jgi:hypothetical protein
MLSRLDLEGSLASGYEFRGIELKGPGLRTDKHLMAKVIRASLSMGNLRDGGHVVIGIDDNDPAALLPGLSEAELDTWLAYDDVARKMAEYADPPLRFDVARMELSSSAEVVVIQVFEFADIPHLCAREYQDVLRKGALYVRPRKVPETSEVASSLEMRDVIHLATEKALRAYVETAQLAGIGLVVSGDTTTSNLPNDIERYKDQTKRAWG